MLLLIADSFASFVAALVSFSLASFSFASTLFANVSLLLFVLFASSPPLSSGFLSPGVTAVLVSISVALGSPSPQPSIGN